MDDGAIVRPHAVHDVRETRCTLKNWLPSVSGRSRSPVHRRPALASQYQYTILFPSMWSTTSLPNVAVAPGKELSWFPKPRLRQLYLIRKVIIQFHNVQSNKSQGIPLYHAALAASSDSVCRIEPSSIFSGGWSSPIGVAASVASSLSRVSTALLRASKPPIQPYQWFLGQQGPRNPSIPS
jgi:hypothetical protein